MSPACISAIAALDNNVNVPCVAKHPYPGTGSSAFGSPEEKEAYKCECSTPGLLGYSQAIVDSCDVIIVADIARYGWLDVFTASQYRPAQEILRWCRGHYIMALLPAPSAVSSSTSTIASGTYPPSTTSSGASGNSTATVRPSYPPSSQTNLVSSATAISPFRRPNPRGCCRRGRLFLFL
ncbi:hypothetical protein DFJ73DRAFT_838876, partial [Zopfochytrium polystomum]